MKYHIARELKVDESQVNIKAGTNEGLGFIGAHEGIAAYAVVLFEVTVKELLLSSHCEPFEVQIWILYWPSGTGLW